MKRKIYFAFLCICFFCMTEVVRATYVTIPTWSENALVETSGEIGENFLDLSCESAILISLDTGEVFSFDNAFFAAVMNLPYEGGGFWFAPALRPEEENFHICVAEQMNRRQILKILPLAFSGNHVGKKGVHILPCTRAVIQTSQPLCVHTDGEILGFFDEISIEAAKDRLNVITG